MWTKGLRKLHYGAPDVSSLHTAETTSSAHALSFPLHDAPVSWEALGSSAVTLRHTHVLYQRMGFMTLHRAPSWFRFCTEHPWFGPKWRCVKVPPKSLDRVRCMSYLFSSLSLCASRSHYETSRVHVIAAFLPRSFPPYTEIWKDW